MQLVEIESKLMMVEEERNQAVDKVDLLRKDLQNSKEEIKKKVNQLT